MNPSRSKQKAQPVVLGRRLRSLGVLAVSGGLLLSGCKPDRPEGVISESTMEDLLYDYHVAQGMAESRTDSVSYYRYLYIRSVFEKYGVSEAEFDSSMVWYSANASYLADMYTRINERYAAELQALGSRVNQTDLYHSLTATGDTANIWRDTDFALLRPGGMDSHYSFTVEADTSFYPGDDVLWQFRNFFVYQEGGREAYAALTVHFDNDSVASVYQHLNTSTTTDLMIRTTREERIRSLTGFVYLTSSEKESKEVFRMMLLNDFKLIRFHEKPEEQKADSTELAADSLRLDADSLANDSLKGKSVVPVRGPQERLSPQELRDNQSGERKIRVVKEKPYSVRRSRP